MSPYFPFVPPHPADLGRHGLNALLRRQPWAQERLAAHAGKSLRVSAGRRWSLACSISSDGSLLACDDAIVPDVILSIPDERLAGLPGIWRSQGMEGVAGLMHIQGDAGLAQLVSELARSLRWDIEADLSRLVGDVLALRLVRTARQLAGGVRQSVARAGDNLAEYLAEESGMLMRGEQLQDMGGQLGELSARLDALERRLHVLGQGRPC